MSIKTKNEENKKLIFVVQKFLSFVALFSQPPCNSEIIRNEILISGKSLDLKKIYSNALIFDEILMR